WAGSSAEDLLKERFVKGEISKEEYEEKLKVIRA
ncbi:MAG: SHOCT domain-containing protein, partial [Patescibacteria group bacterium]|nr:SHOCT domain-containing protein [Patescibacteria group bacterium]